MPLPSDPIELDAPDRAIVNRLQDGLPLCPRPYTAVAGELGMGEDELLQRLSALLARGVLSRFGPLYQIERAGGRFVLAAMAVPAAELDRVAAILNAQPEVAHNYARDHRFNLWFVLAVERADDVAAVEARLEALSGYPVHPFPKLHEFFVNLRLVVPA